MAKKKPYSKETTNKAYVETGFQDEAVQSALKLIEDNSVIHNKHENIWRAIQELFEAGFTCTDPTGTRKITSKLILQILWKVVNKMKIPDFKIHRAGPFAMKSSMEEEKKGQMVRGIVEQAVTAGVATVMKEGKFLQCMKDKGGAFYKSALFGDAHVQVGYDMDNSDYPISFRVGSLSDVYVNNECTDIRDPTGGLSADEVVIIYRYTMAQFDQLFPEWAGKVAPGEIPRANTYRKQLEKTWLQTTYQSYEMIEVGYRIGIDKCMVIFAGAPCTVLKKYEGDPKEDLPAGEVDDSFPYIMDGKPYIPLLHFKFFPSSEGYYNYGIGHMVFDLAMLTAQMDNMAYNHAGDNIWPITFVNSGIKGSSKLFGDILAAHQMRANGGKGYVVSDNPPGQGAGVSIEQFQTPPITQEWERAFTRLEQQITRMGFRLDAPDLGANPNEMSILAEQESTDAPIKQVIEFNTSTFEDAVNFAMDAIRKFIPDDDQTPLNSLVDIDFGGEVKMPMRGVPLGWVAQELRENKYWVEVNSRDGTIPSNVAEQARIDKTFSKLMPGTPAFNKMIIEQAALSGQNISMEDLMPPQAPAPSGPAPSAEGGGPIITETSPINAYALKHPNRVQ